jgi:peptide/nickel transport system ATP-binding protein
MTPPLLSVENLTVEYAIGGKSLFAVSDVSLHVARGETLGLVGESGCGKSTLGRAVLQLRKPTGGRVVFDGTELTTLDAEAMRRTRKRLQLIFQDPIASLNPRRRIGDIVAEPLIITGVTDKAERDRRVRDVMTAVGLDPDVAMGRLPHEFSGGQCQRIAIARALATRPEFIVADEPVSALDVSVQAQIVTLMAELRSAFGLALVFISHDLHVVRHLCERVMVMYLGRVVEEGRSAELFRAPAHPYTQALIAATPSIRPRRRRREVAPSGELPSAASPPSGCVFRTRCPHAIAACAERVPGLREIAPGRHVACIRDDVMARSA